MSNQKGPGAGPGLLILLLVGFGFYAANRPLDLSRPPTSTARPRGMYPPEDVPARLWEDPLRSVREVAATGADGHAPVVGPEQPHGKRRSFGASDDWMLFVSLLHPGPYPEDVENRLRSRYAIQAALASHDFAPADAEHLGTVHLPPPQCVVECPARQHRLRHLFPFERFEYVGEDGTAMSKEVLVLWVAEDELGVDPHAGLHRLIVDVVDRNGPPKSTSVLGPTSSGTLKTIVRESAGFEDPCGDACPFASTTLVSNWATAPDTSLAHLAADANLEAPTGDTLKLGSELRVRREIGTDDNLIQLLIGELKLHEVDVSTDDVALLVEWGSSYSRAFHREFVRRANATDENIALLTYLQGIDGIVPGRGADSDSGSVGGGSYDSSFAELPVGESQVDYVRRLQRRLSKREKPYEAIGIVGNDVYDKILLLRALRREFPRAILFTTDADARYLQRSEYASVRNLIVATHYGLTTTEDAGGDATPFPFRDSYQTSTYRATCKELRAFKDRGKAGVEPGDSVETRGSSVATTEEKFDRLLAATYTNSLFERLWRSVNAKESRESPPDAESASAPSTAPPEGSTTADDAAPAKSQPTSFSSIFGGIAKGATKLLGSAREVFGGLGPLKRSWPPAAGELYEIGRTGFVPLGEPPAATQLPALFLIAALIELLLAISLWLYGTFLVHTMNKLRGFWPVRAARGALYVAVLLVSGSFLLLSALSALDYWNLSTSSPAFKFSALLFALVASSVAWRLLVRAWDQNLSHSTSSRIATLSLPIACTGLFVAGLAMFVQLKRGTGEPFAFIQGVNVWPTIGIRVVVLSISVVCIFQLNRLLAHQDEEILSSFKLDRKRRDGSVDDSHPTYRARSLLSIPIRHDSSGSLPLAWGWYREHGRYRVVRSLVLALLFAILIFCTYHFDRRDFAHARGGLAMEFERWSWGLSLVGVAWLIFFAVDATFLCHQLITPFYQRARQQFWNDPEIEMTAGVPLLKTENPTKRPASLHSLMIMRLVVTVTENVGRLAWYPFILLFVLIVAQSRYMENWSWSGTSTAVFSLCIVAVVITAVALRRAAERLREYLIDDLREDQLIYRVKNDLDKLDELDQAVEEVKTTRRGAFLPLIEHPVITAVLLPFGGVGTVALLELLGS